MFDALAGSDFKEWVAGTAMNDNSKKFEIAEQGMITNVSDMVISWDSVPGRYYSVISTTNLLGDDRQTNLHRANGNGQRMRYTNSTATELKCFYIKVEDR